MGVSRGSGTVPALSLPPWLTPGEDGLVAAGEMPPSLPWRLNVKRDGVPGSWRIVPRGVGMKGRAVTLGDTAEGGGASDGVVLPDCGPAAPRPGWCLTTPVTTTSAGLATAPAWPVLGDSGDEAYTPALRWPVLEAPARESEPRTDGNAAPRERGAVRPSLLAALDAVAGLRDRLGLPRACLGGRSADVSRDATLDATVLLATAPRCTMGDTFGASSRRGVVGLRRAARPAVAAGVAWVGAGSARGLNS